MYMFDWTISFYFKYELAEILLKEKRVGAEEIQISEKTNRILRYPQESSSKS